MELTELEVRLLLLQNANQTLERKHPPATNWAEQFHEPGNVKSIVVVRVEGIGWVKK